MIERAEYRVTQPAHEPAVDQIQIDKPDITPRETRDKLRLKATLAVTSLALIALAALACREADSSSQTPQQGLPVTEVGVLDISPPEECRTGLCGSKYRLVTDQNLSESPADHIPLLGDIDDNDRNRLIRVVGHEEILPESEYGVFDPTLYEGPKEALRVDSYSAISEVKYIPDLRDQAGQYVLENYPCAATIAEIPGEPTIITWAKAFTWSLNGGEPTFAVRMTDIESSKSPQPYIEVSFDGDGNIVGDPEVSEENLCPQ